MKLGWYCSVPEWKSRRKRPVILVMIIIVLVFLSLCSRQPTNEVPETLLPRQLEVPPLQDTCPKNLLGPPEVLQGLQHCQDSQQCRPITCNDLLFGRENPLDMYHQAVVFMLNHPKQPKTDGDYLEMTRDCPAFIRDRQYVMEPMNSEEADFPLAYNVIVHQDIEQIERLFRAIYRPQNSYCFHLDSKAPDLLQKSLRAVIACFPNAFLVSKQENIIYAGISRLKADLNCMKDHLKRGHPWKYLLNVAGQSFPLRTNQELVQILKLYNGMNDIEGIVGHRVLRDRFVYEWIEVEKLPKPVVTGRFNPRPPHGLSIVRGSAYGAFSRDFVKFVLYDQIAQDLLLWSRWTYSPDEHYWATLNHAYINPQVKAPGSYPGHPDTKTWIGTFAKWRGQSHCFSIWKRDICVFGVMDLPDLMARHDLFCNKLYLDHQPAALDCLEAWHNYKTRCPQPMNLDIYRNLEIVKYANKSSGHVSAHP